MAKIRNRLVVAVLNGWSASFWRTRTANVVEDVLAHNIYRFHMLAMKSVFWKYRVRQFRRFIKKHEHPSNCLLCVSKSYGVINMLNVVNDLPFKEESEGGYRHKAFVSCDPCWPDWDDDWTPNCNEYNVYLRTKFDHAINVFLRAPENAQAGSPLMYYGPGGAKWLENRILLYEDGVTHFNIPLTPEFRAAVDEEINRLGQRLAVWRIQ